MLRNPSNEEMDVFIVNARPEPRLNESSSTYLDGGWFVQTIGEAAEVIKVKLVCRWLVLQEIMLYAKSKQILHVEFLDFEKNGYIMGVPSYDIAELDETNPRYNVTFEMAVIPSV